MSDSDFRQYADVELRQYLPVSKRKRGKGGPGVGTAAFQPIRIAHQTIDIVWRTLREDGHGGSLSYRRERVGEDWH